MTALHFTGNLRTAARTILDDTPLGDTLARLNATFDDGTCLTITDCEEWHYDGNLSTGERELMQFLASLTGQGLVSVYWLLQRIDADCQVAVVHAIAAACGISVAVEAVSA